MLPPDELIKDLFAEFGLAYYQSEVLCKGLGIFYALMSFKDASDITRPRIEEKLVDGATLTLGIIVNNVKPLVSAELQERLDQALEKRNYLAHHLWYERAYEIQNKLGIVKLTLELREIRQVFEELDSEITTLATQRLRDIGVSSQTIDEQIQKGLLGEPEPSLIIRPRLSRKMVRITKAYDVALENGSSALIFVTDDQQLLELCDVGLGWSNFTNVESNWTVNKILDQYLPASIVPRPEITDAWNYELILPKNSVLWVKKAKTEKFFRWGIRSTKK